MKSYRKAFAGDSQERHYGRTVQTDWGTVRLPVKVVSERTLKEGLEFTDNRFVVEGNYKYTYNNGHLAMADPVAAARNFLNALEKIPSTID